MSQNLYLEQWFLSNSVCQLVANNTACRILSDVPWRTLKYGTKRFWWRCVSADLCEQLRSGGAARVSAGVLPDNLKRPTPRCQAVLLLRRSSKNLGSRSCLICPCLQRGKAHCSSLKFAPCVPLTPSRVFPPPPPPPPAPSHPRFVMETCLREPGEGQCCLFFKVSTWLYSPFFSIFL